MVRLILEEDGNRRAFKVNPGKLSIGSGEGCTLTLSSPDVAEQHAELEVRDGDVVLKPKPGVMPPTVKGVPVRKDKTLAPGSEFKIGGATFRVEDPDAPAQKAPARGSKAVGTPRTNAGRDGSARVQRTRPVATIEHGMPSWLIVGIILVVLVGGGFMLLKTFGEQANSGTDSPAETLRFAESHWYDAGNKNGAELKLAMLDPSSLSGDLKTRYEKLRKDLDNVEEVNENREREREGTTFLETQLKRFEETRLQGTPDPKKVRVFLLRCREFRETYPGHPQEDWVTRQESRFKGYVDMTRPATFEEVAYEIETLTWSFPQKYEEAFKRLAPYLQSDPGPASELHDKLTEERNFNFDDRMKQAKYLWMEKEEKGKSVDTLKSLIIWYGDPAMTTQAANEMIALPGIKEWLVGYKRDFPGTFDQMMENSVLRGYARDEGIL